MDGASVAAVGFRLVDEAFDHRRRTAAIEVRVARCSRHRVGHRKQFAGLVVEMELEVRYIGQPVSKKEVVTVAEGRVEAEWTAEFGQSPRHRKQRGNSDSAADQNRERRAFRQRKIVARRTHVDGIADPQSIVHRGGASATPGLLAYSDRVFSRYRVGFEQGVLPLQAIWKTHCNMRPRLRGGQRFAVRTSKPKEARIGPSWFGPHHAQLLGQRFGRA